MSRRKQARSSSDLGTTAHAEAKKQTRNGDRRNRANRDESVRPFAPLALIAAALLVAACLIPLVLWGDPYPDAAVRYWGFGGVIAVVATAAISAMPADPLGPVADWLSAISPAVFASLVAVVALILSVGFAVFAFHRAPSTSDEVATLWHARILLHGRLSLPVDPNREFFSLDNVVDVGRWYSQFPIGGPLFVALGAAVGAPWLVNPVLIAACAALLYQFGRRAFGEHLGRASAALFALSPMVLMMAGTWMNHVPTLFLALCALVALSEWVAAISLTRALCFAAVIGFAIGGIATIRPLDAIVVTMVVGGFQLFVISRDSIRAREILVQVVFGALGVAPLLYANWATTGHMLTFGYDMSWGAGHRIGFHTDPYGNAHTAGQALEYAVTYVSELNMYLMAWPIPVLLLAVIGLLVRQRTTRWDALIFAFFAAQVAAYAAYWGDGEFLGPRFMYTALPAAIIVIARLPFAMGDRFGGAWQRRTATLLVVCVAIAWSERVASYSALGLATQASRTRQLLKADIAGAVRAANVHRAIVFLREPFGSRLSRRLWGIGVPRSDAAQLLASRDACSLLTEVRAAEADTAATAASSLSMVRSAAEFIPGTDPVPAADRTVHISSPASVTPECRRELDVDMEPGAAAFGPALPLEPIGRDGRLEGDVIYAADLGERNAVLQSRFGDRASYRLMLLKDGRGRFEASLVKY